MIEYEINPESGVCAGCMYYTAKNIDVKIENRPNPCTMCSRNYTDHYKGSIIPLSYEKKVKVSKEYKNIH